MYIQYTGGNMRNINYALVTQMLMQQNERKSTAYLHLRESVDAFEKEMFEVFKENFVDFLPTGATNTVENQYQELSETIRTVFSLIKKEGKMEIKEANRAKDYSELLVRQLSKLEHREELKVENLIVVAKMLRYALDEVVSYLEAEEELVGFKEADAYFLPDDKGEVLDDKYTGVLLYATDKNYVFSRNHRREGIDRENWNTGYLMCTMWDCDKEMFDKLKKY